MDLMTLRTLQREVARQCLFAILSTQLLDASNGAMHQAHDAMRLAPRSSLPDTPEDAQEVFRQMGERRKQADEAREVTDAATQQLWYAAQNFLIAAGNLSKLLWGTKAGTDAPTWAKRQQDRRQLRSSLGVADNSVLKLSPQFRNHFEHMDERIEEWAEKSTRHNLVTDLIGSTSMIAGVDPSDFLRSYDPTVHTLSTRAVTVHVPDLP